MSNLKQRDIPQVGRRNPESHIGYPISLTDSGGGKSSAKTNQRQRKQKEKKYNRIHIATYNIRSMAQNEKLYELEEELSKIKWDIVGLSEVKRRGETCVELDSGNRLYYKGKENETYGGIGFLIKKDIKQNVIKYKSISDRVGYIIIEINRKTRIKLIQVYAPTTTHEEEEVDQFYEDITTAIEDKNIKPTVIMGDFNAKIGKKTEESENKIGDHGLGARNLRGEKLMDYLEQQNLHAINTYFNKRPNRKWTWISPNGETKNEIDYFLCQNKEIFEDVTALNKFSTGSDHRILRAKIAANKLEKKKTIKKPTAIDHNKIRQNADDYRRILRNNHKHQSETEELDINKINKEIKEKLLEAGMKSAKKTRAKENRLNNETIKLMNNRRKLISENKRNTVEYVELNKLIRRKTREDLRKHNENEIEKVIERNRGLKCLRPNLGKQLFISVRDETGRELRETDKISEEVERFYKELYTSKKDATISTQEYIKKRIMNVNSETLPKIENYEIEAALSQLKNNKAPGPDGILAEMLKEGKAEIMQILKNLFNQCLHKGEIPEEWNESLTILLFKKGDKQDLKNYRPISLLSQTYKLFTRIINNRLTNKMDSYQPVEQAGFRKGYSTTDHLLTIRTLIEKANEYHLDLYLAFVDYEKAFDSVEMWAIEKAINNCRIDSRYRMLIHNIYKNATMTIQLQETTKPIPIKRGVRQGDVISPKLFTLALEDVFRAMDWANMGININGKKLNHLRYADDVVIIASTFEELETMLTELTRESEKVGLKMNYAKTKIMTNTQEIRNVILNGTIIEAVNDYIYLGQTIKINKENQTAEVKRRVRLAWAGFGKLKWVLKNKKIQQYLKTRVFDQCILPILTYACQTWTLTKANIDKIKKTQRAMERSMLGIKLQDKKQNNWIRNKTKVKDAGQHIAKLKWDFAGHNARQKDNRWNTTIQQWRPWTGKRARGRPQMRWGDDIKKIGGIHWKQKAQNRNDWKKLGEAYVQSWTN